MNNQFTSNVSRRLQAAQNASLPNQKRALRELLSHVWRCSIFYRDYYRAHGLKEDDIPELGVADLPLMSKKLLMENFDKAVTDSRLRYGDIQRWMGDNADPHEDFLNEFTVIQSSGSSGSVGTIVYDRRGWQIANSVLANRLPLPENYPSGKTKVAFFLAAHGHFGGVSTAARMTKGVYDTLILSLRDPSEYTLRRLNAFSPHRLQGYSSTIATLAENAIAGKLQISPQRILVSGDQLTVEMESLIQRAWNAPIYNLYSASESKYIAIREPGRREMVVLDELNIVELLDDENQLVKRGETGRVVLTNLHNYLLPILRYELEDYAELAATGPDAPCSTIRDLKGRVNVSLPVLLEDGSEDFIHPLLLEDLHVNGLKRIQFVSQRPDRVQIEYIASESIDAVIRREFQRLLNVKNALRTTFEIARVEHLSPDPRTGKINLIRFAEQPSFTHRSIAPLAPATLAMGKKHNRPKPPVFPSAIEEFEQSIPDRFETIAHLYAHRLSIQSETASVTYAELNRTANQLAHTILTRYGKGDEPIAILLDHDAAIIVALLGVLKAAKPYVPLEPSNPETRILSAFRDSQAKYLIVNDDTLPLVNRMHLSLDAVINLDRIDPNVSTENPGLPIAPDSFACVLYTSGSSGEPKGVIQNHRNVIHNAMMYAYGCGIGPADRITLFASLGTGQGTPSAFSALLSGAVLLPFDVRKNGVADLGRWLSTQAATVYISAPTLFRQFAATLTEQETFPNLRLIRLGAEKIQKSDVELYKRYFSASCTFAAFLSSTETGNLCQYHIDKQTEIGADDVPAGYPVDGVEIRLVDSHGQEIGCNEIGEIVVKSRYLSPGYWQNPELTNRVFLIDPKGSDQRIYYTGDLGRMMPDGCLEHLGRRDSQTKIRGFRVDTAEIESALLALDLVEEAVVEVRNESPSHTGVGTRLVAYLVPSETATVTVGALRSRLAKKLPGHMIPTAFIVLKAMPLTPTGKVDRRALPDPEKTRPLLDIPYISPRTAVEKDLAQIWADVLSLDRVGIHDNFFDLGGHSLAATRIVSRVLAQFQTKLPFQSLFANPTIAGLAVVIGKPKKHPANGDAAVYRRLDLLDSLTDDQARQLLASGSANALFKLKTEDFEH